MHRLFMKEKKKVLIEPKCRLQARSFNDIDLITLDC